ncbi:G-patch domain family protein [Babesia bovis T2Bo]|uniref:G-patch domain-containing protein n=1 Tax=Babesia bovis TaxID=5865 RepID=A7ARV1_BABBO|nr:G-patch domain family protein [Babesia bovis T2Bo]EDO07270.1 G-patch domain family protein [Babesia bovis T2Bo]|eukprot:XP_001610838.1 hypothetical protein [Babesia bovis T2Bo]
MWDNTALPQGTSASSRVHSGSTPFVKSRRQQYSYNPNDVYDPMYPNDYEHLSREFARRATAQTTRVELKIKKVEGPKLSAEEAYERRMKLLDSADNTVTQDATDTSKGVGMRIMQKLGWTEGKGLGANEQGIVAPLVAKNTGKHVGVIVQGAKLGANPAHSTSQSTVPRDRVTASAGGMAATRVLKLTFECTIDDTDRLQEELEESLSQYGSLIEVVVHRSDTTISYCEFEDDSQALRAMNNVDKVLPQYRKTATFATEEEYNNL